MTFQITPTVFTEMSQTVNRSETLGPKGFTAGYKDFGVMIAGYKDFGVMIAGYKDFGVMTPLPTLGKAA